MITTGLYTSLTLSYLIFTTTLFSVGIYWPCLLMKKMKIKEVDNLPKETQLVSGKLGFHASCLTLNLVFFIQHEKILSFSS